MCTENSSNRKTLKRSVHQDRRARKRRLSGRVLGYRAEGGASGHHLKGTGDHGEDAHRILYHGNHSFQQSITGTTNGMTQRLTQQH